VTVLGIISSVVFSMLWGATHGLADKRDAELDEREIGLRNKTYRMAYVAAAYALFPVAIVIAYEFPERGLVQTLWAFAAAWMVFWAVPTSILAWTEPAEEAVEA
jgi:hypothetical protein